MSLFESAHATDAGTGAGGSGLINLLFLGGFVLIFYFLLIRPQSKRRKEHAALVAALSKGDEVITAGGIVGSVTKVEDDFVKVQLASKLEVRIQKSAVSATLPKGTLKTLDEAS